MTNEELSAKVAQARGEVVFRKCNSPWAEGCHAFVAIEKAKEPRWSMPDETPELSADAYRDVKPYATDMNAAGELLDEVPMWSLFCTSLPSGKEFTCKIHNCTVCEDGKYKNKSGALGKCVSTPRAICRAYLAFKGVEI